MNILPKDTIEELKEVTSPTITEIVYHMIVSGKSDIYDFSRVVVFKVEFMLIDKRLECYVPISRSLYEDINYDLWHNTILPVIKDWYDATK